MFLAEHKHRVAIGRAGVVVEGFWIRVFDYLHIEKTPDFSSVDFLLVGIRTNVDPLGVPAQVIRHARANHSDVVSTGEGWGAVLFQDGSRFVQVLQFGENAPTIIFVDDDFEGVE